MIFKRFLLIVIYVATIGKIQISNAQKEATFWYFGYHAGLSFKSGNPVALKDGVLKANHGSAVISDKDSGDLLFYTDGRNFWNGKHELMPGSIFLPDKCWTQVTQPAIIVPDSENNYLFNVFCLRVPDEVEDVYGNNCVYESKTNTYPGMKLYYFLIDMRLDNGWGDIVADRSNILIRTDVTEKLTAIPKLNSKDHWIVVHGWNSNQFYSYPLSSTVYGNPVVTSIGSVHEVKGGVDSQEIRGYMKASPNGKKIACAVSDHLRPFDLFDFDASTGTLSNYINLGNLRGQYGLSFSPDNSKLYLSTDSPTDESHKYIILQYDLLAGDSASIVASGQSIILNNPYTNIPDFGIFEGFDEERKGFQLGLDGRLYVTSNASFYESIPERGVLVVIDQPNKKGFECMVNYKHFNFDEGSTSLGLPNFIQSYFNNIESLTVCDQPTSITFFPNPTTGKINIDVLQGCPQTYSLEIMNALGQVIFSQSTGTITTEVDISFLASGLYFLRVRTPGNAVLIKKIIRA